MKIRYLTNQDYNVIVQSSQLVGQLLQDNPKTLIQAENYAQEEAYSLLQQRFIIDAEFTNTAPWQYTATYSATDRVIMDYPLYYATLTYTTGECVIFNGEAYCLTGTASWTGPFVNTYFSDLGPQYEIYYTKYPAPLFDYEINYLQNSVVFWNGFTYSATSPTTPLSESQALQFKVIDQVPTNVFPDDPINNGNSQFWAKTATQSYVIPAHTLPTNTNYWIDGDNRSQLLVYHLTNIVVFYLNKTITPDLVPEFRVKAYEEAIQYLKDIALGEKNSPLLMYQPDEGMVVRFGGNVRKPTIW